MIALTRSDLLCARTPRLFCALAMALCLASLTSRAQDTTHAVRIGLTYQPGTKPGVIVLAVRGAWGMWLRLQYGHKV